MFYARAIESSLKPSPIPVVVLEGARAVGKTVVAQRLVEAGIYDDYVNLADPLTAQLASMDTPHWLASLPERTVIDEAQLLPDLPLYVKLLVDRPGSKRSLLLTGSAALGRTGLGGADPLTGRAIRRRIWPMTRFELLSKPERMLTLIDDLFSGEIASQRNHPPLGVESLLRTGGFPRLAIAQADEATVERWVEGATTGLLTEHVLPDERFDAGSARRVLDGCLREPGGILNLASLGQRLGADPRTVDRYLDVLERRFLLHHLPNLAQNLARQNRARAKIHAVDTAFVSEAIRRADPAKSASPHVLGKVFETWVVNQLLPCLEVTHRAVSAFYWRDAIRGKNKPEGQKQNEVDLVLIDGTGATVGIEVKMSSTFSLHDIGGLQSLRKARGMDFGYLIYTGTKTMRLAENIYALPVAALG